MSDDYAEAKIYYNDNNILTILCFHQFNTSNQNSASSECCDVCCKPFSPELLDEVRKLQEEDDD
jgi:hypothetical protein